MKLAKPNSKLLFWLRLGTLSLSQLETVATQHNLKARVGAGLQKTGCSEQRDVRTLTQPTHFQMCRQKVQSSLRKLKFERRCLT
jgi:hypothetical protein